MSEWAARRFWTAAGVEAAPGGWAIRLDGRAVRTPNKTEVIVPSRALAEGMAAEWDAQDKLIDPLSMPLNRASNAALDKVAPQAAEVAGMLAGYGETDLLSYRAASPEALAARQAEAWDPLLDWAAERFGARLGTTAGVIPVDQDRGALERLAAQVAAHDPWETVALHEFVTMSGSLVLGLAVMDGRLPPEEAWRLSRIDEAWQIEQWGEDEEEAERIAAKRSEFLQAHRFLTLLREHASH